MGLAGPTWGLFAAGVAWTVALATGWAAWAAIARAAARLNLFNLLPVAFLDGGMLLVLLLAALSAGASTTAAVQ